jgi:hypothetical protein
MIGTYSAMSRASVSSVMLSRFNMTDCIGTRATRPTTRPKPKLPSPLSHSAPNTPLACETRGWRVVREGVWAAHDGMQPSEGGACEL